MNYYTQDELWGDDDICSNYHKGNPESKEANRRTNKVRDTARIVNYLICNPEGSTCDHMEHILGISHQTASARCSELLRSGAIRRKPMPGGGYERAATRAGSMAAILLISYP